jgi:hypothetical protein
MKENKYDDPDFFAKYATMPRSVCGFECASEWPAFTFAMLVLEHLRT